MAEAEKMIAASEKANSRAADVGSSILHEVRKSLTNCHPGFQERLVIRKLPIVFGNILSSRGRRAAMQLHCTLPNFVVLYSNSICTNVRGISQNMSHSIENQMLKRINDTGQSVF